MDMLLVLLMWSQFAQMVTSIIDLGECGSALGMNDGSITDDQIVASSVYQDDNIAFGAQNSRLDQNSGDGAWCPHSVHPETTAPSEFLQITFRMPTVITVFGVQGRHNYGYGKEFVRRLRFEYSRDSQNWIRYKDVHGREVFDGNIDANSSSTVHIGPPIIAKAVRILPVVQYTQRVCLRLELYGCLWEDRLLSYSAPVGDLRGVNAFEDDSYDGIRFKDTLFDGLGQLTDGTLGSSDFRFSPSNRTQGYEWVGWKNLSHPNPSFEFTFDTLRNFSSVSLHASNYYSKHVELFYLVEVMFSVEPGHYSPQVIKKFVQKDSLHPEARWITVGLQQRVAKYLKIRLHHRGRWILLSEVSFSSEPAFEIQDGSPEGLNDITEGGGKGSIAAVVLGILLVLVVIFALVSFLAYRQKCRGKYVLPPDCPGGDTDIGEEPKTNCQVGTQTSGENQKQNCQVGTQTSGENQRKNCQTSSLTYISVGSRKACTKRTQTSPVDQDKGKSSDRQVADKQEIQQKETCHEPVDQDKGKSSDRQVADKQEIQQKETRHEPERHSYGIFSYLFERFAGIRRFFTHRTAGDDEEKVQPKASDVIPPGTVPKRIEELKQKAGASGSTQV